MRFTSKQTTPNKKLTVK